MIDVLKRRNEIENYLTNLDVQKPDEVITRGQIMHTMSGEETMNLAELKQQMGWK